MDGKVSDPEGRPRGMQRRRFLGQVSLASAALASGDRLLAGPTAGVAPAESFDALARRLLGEWTEGMRRRQIRSPRDPARHGALDCPACGFIHGRCMDAVHPFLHMARRTGEERWMRSAVEVFEWSRNVTLESGAWTVMPDPKSWRGITIFGAIALAESLHHHGDLLDTAVRKRWTTRLSRAADFVLGFFNIKFSNINYSATALHGFHLFTKVLDDPKYLRRARELAAELRGFFTAPNELLYGEGKPKEKSSRGRYPVDLGYNVEESLPALALYALDTGDEALTRRVADSMRSHLAFLLP
ncbi:MAG: hypothetical protein V2J10_02630, partial [Wenzhouxiangella sp.]|nr:hypothetical protein [Wenzhouxiangella sp.]